MVVPSISDAHNAHLNVVLTELEIEVTVFGMGKIATKVKMVLQELSLLLLGLLLVRILL